MACGCNKPRPRSASAAPVRTLYRVVLDGGKGKTAFQTHAPATAQAVAKNYPGSIVDPDPGEASAAQSTAPDATSVTAT
ncbi:hypothetical protein [Streptomyces prunicolor]|uniref:hypothetical protein n=1 Tax=Streptomyces prunicolor TaxID=67348 RepID=UPI00036CEA97|nr:hypothetical protein [Streptomyces prunicolor]